MLRYWTISCLCTTSDKQIVEMNDDNSIDNGKIEVPNREDLTSYDNDPLNTLVVELEADDLASDNFVPIVTTITDLIQPIDEIDNNNVANMDRDSIDNCSNSKIDMIVLQNIDGNRKIDIKTKNFINTQHHIMELDKENNQFIKKLTPNKQVFSENNTVYTPHTQIKMLYSPDNSPKEIPLPNKCSPIINEISFNIDEVLRLIFNKLRKDKETINIMQFIHVYRRLCKAGEKGNLFKEMTLANNFSNNGTINEEQFVKGFNEYIVANNSNPKAIQLLLENL